MKNKEFEKILLKKYGFENIKNISGEKIKLIKYFLEITIREILYFLKIKKRGLYRWSPTSAYWGDHDKFIEKKTKKKNNQKI
jgi:hypothetical protein